PLGRELAGGRVGVGCRPVPLVIRRYAGGLVGPLLGLAGARLRLGGGPPPVAAPADPTTIAKTAYHRPVTIRGAIRSWSRAAKAPKISTAMPAPLAMTWPPETLLSRVDSRSVSALGIAAATTMMTIATSTLGR